MNLPNHAHKHKYENKHTHNQPYESTHLGVDRNDLVTYADELALLDRSRSAGALPLKVRHDDPRFVLMFETEAERPLIEGELDHLQGLVVMVVVVVVVVR